MTFFESLLVLVLAAIVLLQVARRLSLPYPAMLAGAGVIGALIPGTPIFPLSPQLISRSLSPLPLGLVGIFEKKPAPAKFSETLFVGWCGMRGVGTIATAFALPENFPQRDTVVLTAFCVVLATLVLQGLTLAPLIKLLKLDRSGYAAHEPSFARAALAEAALASIAGQDGPGNLRYRLSLIQRTCRRETGVESLERYRELGLKAIEAEREQLEMLRTNDRIGPDAYLGLQEHPNWSELTLLRDIDRRIEEI